MADAGAVMGTGKGSSAGLRSLQNSIKRVSPFIWIAVAVVATTGTIAGLATATVPASNKLSGKSAAAARELIATATTLANQASQDTDPRQRQRDISMGLAYVAAARFLASDEVLQARTGVKVPELWATLRAQDAATAAMP